MKTEQQKSNAGYTTFMVAVIVSLIFGLTASVVMAAVNCQTVRDGNKKCEGKADPATTGSCTGGCGVGENCTGSKTEYDYTNCDECKLGGSSCDEYKSPFTPNDCTEGWCTIKQRTKDCKCYGPASTRTCGIDPADNTDWGGPTNTRNDECE